MQSRGGQSPWDRAGLSRKNMGWWRGQERRITSTVVKDVKGSRKAKKGRTGRRPLVTSKDQIQRRS